MTRGVAIVGAIAVLIGCALQAGTGVAAHDGCARATAVAEDATLQRAIDAVLCLVNRERAARGLPAVHASRQLTRSARGHSRDMVARTYFSHVSPAGEKVRQRVLRTGYVSKRQAGKLGETIAWGTAQFATPAQLVRSFMASRGHRRVVLDGSYRDVGIGLVPAAPVAGVPGEAATLTVDFGRR